ncbi:MAG: MATE family efflux transporter [Planctomycetota bacterium]|nr:MATE family efflux transporter [Planctomycetota bacterium]
MSNPAPTPQQPSGPGDDAHTLRVPPEVNDLSDLHASEGVQAQPPERRSSATPGLTPDGRLLAGRLAGLSMPVAIWTLSWPVLAESVLGSLVGLTDTILAAGLDDGASATDAIGFASYGMWFVGLIVAALGVGATAVIARAVGARRLAVARAALSQTVLIALVSGVLVGVVIALSTPVIARSIALSPAAARMFEQFLLINAFGVPFSSLVYAGRECLRGVGDSRGPLRVMVVVNIVNIFASWALSGVDLKSTKLVEGVPESTILLANPFSLDLGVEGIAWGTVLAYFAGALLMLRLLMRGSGGVNLRARRLLPHWITIQRIVRVGLPNFLETAGMWLGNMLVILAVGWIGLRSAGALGAHLIAIRVESFSFLPGFSMGVAAATLAGQYLGAGSPALARRAVLACLAIALSLMAAGGAVFILLPKSLVSIISAQPEHLSLVPPLLIVAGVIQIPFAVSLVLRSALRGVGDTRAVMWITWLTTWAIRLPLVYVCSGVDIPLGDGKAIENPFAPFLPWEPGLLGLWIGLCTEIVVRGVLFAHRFFVGSWAARRV